MSNGVRRTAASGLMASAGSNVSKRYKRLAHKLGVKHKTPGALIQASRKHKAVKRKITKNSMDYVAPLKAATKAASGAFRGAAAGLAKIRKPASNSPERLRQITNGVAKTRARTVDAWNQQQGVQAKPRSLKANYIQQGGVSKRQGAISSQEMKKMAEAIGKMGSGFSKPKDRKTLPYQKPSRPGLPGLKLPKLPGKFGRIQDGIRKYRNRRKPNIQLLKAGGLGARFKSVKRKK